jgi:hypothetical protein
MGNQKENGIKITFIAQSSLEFNIIRNVENAERSLHSLVERRRGRSYRLDCCLRKVNPRGDPGTMNVANWRRIGSGDLLEIDF